MRGAGDVNPIAGLEIGDARADRFDVAGAVHPRRVRQRRFPRVGAGVDVGVHRVDAGRAHADHDLAGSRHRIGNLFELHDRRSAVFVNANCAHCDLLRSGSSQTDSRLPTLDYRPRLLIVARDATMGSSMQLVKLHKTVGVKVGDVQVGGGAPVVVQSMTMTDTADARATAQQCIELAEAGSELVRITVNLPEAAAAVPEIKQRMLDAGCKAPLIGDFHYNGHLLLTKFPDCASRARQVPDQSRQRRHRPPTRRAVLDHLQSRRGPRQAGPHRRQRRLAESGAGAREDAGEHRPRSGPVVRGHHQRVHGAVGDRVDRAGDRERTARRTRSSFPARRRGRGI